MKIKWIGIISVIFLFGLGLFFFKVGYFELKSNEDKQNEMIHMIEKNDKAKVMQLIEKDYPIQFVSKDGFTPLEIALNHHYFEIAKILLEHGGDINKQAISPLFVQIISTFDDYEQIKENSDYEETINLYNTLITQAYKHHDKEINTPDQFGNTAFHIAANKGHVNVINKLMELGSDPKILNKNGESPFLTAVKVGHIQATKTLFDKKTMKKADLEGNNALIWAALNGRMEAAKFLIDNMKLEEINVQNKFGQTALIVASDYGYKEMVEILLDAGADRSLKSNEGKTAKDYAQQWGHQEIVDHLE